MIILKWILKMLDVGMDWIDLLMMGTGSGLF
jgi:hypothetical protein